MRLRALLVDVVTWEWWGCLASIAIVVLGWGVLVKALVTSGLFHDFWSTFWLFPFVVAIVLAAMVFLLVLADKVWCAVTKPVKKWWRGVVAEEMKSRDL